MINDQPITLAEAIEHAEQISQTANNQTCCFEHLQLVAWLKELQQLKGTKWVQVSTEKIKKSLDPYTDPSGFSMIESKCMNALLECIDAWHQMERTHPSEEHDFVNAVHVIQRLMGQRVLRRAYPDGWPTYRREVKT